MTPLPEPASAALAARCADLPLPPDPALLASLCSDTFEALLDAEARIERLEMAIARNRRIGIVIGIIMAVERVSESQAERLLRNRGQALPWPLRSMAERIIGGHSSTDHLVAPTLRVVR